MATPATIIQQTEVINSSKRLVKLWTKAGWKMTEIPPVPLAYIVFDLLSAAGVQETEIKKVIGVSGSKMID